MKVKIRAAAGSEGREKFGPQIPYPEEKFQGAERIL